MIDLMSAYIVMKLLSLGHILNDEKLNLLINILNQSIQCWVIYGLLFIVTAFISIIQYDTKKLSFYIKFEVNFLERITARNLMY